MDTGLKDRIVLVTGATGGIGGEIVRQFLNERARVVIHTFRQQQAAVSLARELGDRVLPVAADLRSETDTESMFSRIEAHWGHVDTLVANAGVWPPDEIPIVDMTLNQWNDTLATDLTSVFLCLRRFFQGIRVGQLPEPSAVLTASTAGVYGEAGHADYAAAKSALCGGLLLTAKNEMTKLAPRGRVNAVAPGWTLTPMTDKFAADPQALRRATQTIALGKVAAPSDIAAAIVFLASPLAAGHITGQTLVVSGGMEGRILHDA